MFDTHEEILTWIFENFHSKIFFNDLEAIGNKLEVERCWEFSISAWNKNKIDRFYNWTLYALILEK